MRFTPENIQELEPNEIFVFGSNLAGKHIGGAAKIAHEKFGAATDVGEGMTGQSYAFPTLNEDFSQRTEEELKDSVVELFLAANVWSNNTFLVTRVGCGIAGFSEEYMAKLFQNSPSNIIKPSGW